MTPHMKVKSAKHGNAPESGGTPAAAEAISTQSWASYFSGSEWFAFGLFMVLGVILRWTMLDMRPYHHDESLHGMYGRYFYDWPNSNFYRYDITRYNAGVTYRFMRNQTVFLSVNNIGEEGTSIYTYTPIRPRQMFVASQTLKFGITGQF